MREAHRGEKEFIAQWKDRRTERSRQHAMQTRVAQDSLLREAAEVQELQLFSKQASIKESVSANRVAKERAAAEKREIRIAEASEMRQQSRQRERSRQEHQMRLALVRRLAHDAVVEERFVDPAIDEMMRQYPTATDYFYTYSPPALQ